MYKSGDWIIDNESGRLGTVANVFADGISAKFGGMTAIRKFENVSAAGVDIHDDDLASMIDIALQTRDKQWFLSLLDKLGAKFNG